MKRSLGADTLLLPSPVWVVGSYNISGQPNLMTVSWGGICCTTPPCIAISIRKSRLSHSNILDAGAFTVNVPSQQHLSATDYIGTTSGATHDKFSETGLTAIRGEMVNAPYIQEFPLVLECVLMHSLDLGSHTQLIGGILDVKAEEAILGPNGLPNAAFINPIIASAPERAYYAIGACLSPTGRPCRTAGEHQHLMSQPCGATEPYSG